MFKQFVLWMFLINRVFSYNLMMAVDYFHYRNVKSVCLLTCRHKIWQKSFSVEASLRGILTSAFNLEDLNSIEVMKCLNQRTYAIGILLEIQCRNSEIILEMASKERLFNDMRKWLLLSDVNQNNTDSKYVSEDYNSTLNLVKFDEVGPLRDNAIRDLPAVSVERLLNLNLSIDADFALALQRDSTSYDLLDVYNFGKIQGGNLTIKYQGSWTQNNGLQLFWSGYKYYQRWNFQQLNLRTICVMLQRPEVFYPELLFGSQYTPGVAVITKISAMVLEIIREVHNISFTYTITDRWIGPPDKNSTRVVSNSLHFREQDITPCIRLAPSLLNSLDPIFPSTASIETKVFYRIPTHGIGRPENEFGRPFSTGSWITASVAAIICGALLLAAAQIEEHPSPFQFALFTVLASISQQFYDDGVRCKETAGRKLVVLLTGMCYLLLYNYYTSSVVSWLLSGPPPSINTLAELIDSPLVLYFEDVGYTRSWLQTPGYYFNVKNAISEDKLRKTKHLQGSPPLKSLQEGIELVRSGGYAYHTEPYNANLWISRTFTQNDLCQLGALQVMEKTPVYAAVQYKSPYREFFTWSITRAYERGHVSCIRPRVSMTVLGCENTIPRSLALGGAAPAFMLLVFGFFLSTVIVLGERFVFRLSSQRLENIRLTFIH